jgi:hypothetical protein
MCNILLEYIIIVKSSIVSYLVYRGNCGELSNMCHPYCTINKVNNNNDPINVLIPSTNINEEIPFQRLQAFAQM